MSIDQAIKTYVAFVSKAFSARKTGGGGKFNTKTFENAIKGIVKDVTGNSYECILDEHPNACKV